MIQWSSGHFDVIESLNDEKYPIKQKWTIIESYI